MRRARLVLLVVLVLLGLAFLLLSLPFPPVPPPPVPPAPTYAEAMAAFDRTLAVTPASVRPDCRPRVLSHGQPTERVYVLLHGLSNGPVQFQAFAPLLFDQGSNVVIPRLPYHGETDRMNAEWGQLTAQDMLDTANAAVDQARGLGKKVTVLGLSVDGTVAAWIAQNRSDVDQSVILAPFIVPLAIPRIAAVPAARILSVLPNRFIWWNAKLKENLRGPSYVYPRFPTRTVASVIGLGSSVLAQAKTEPPKCGSILVVTSASDWAVNNRVNDELVARWKATRPDAVTAYRFPASEKVPHDCMDPNQLDQQTAIAYPKLLDLLARRP